MDFNDTENANQQPIVEEAPEAVEPLSVTDKFIGVLTEPAPTFENVAKAGPRTSDWLIPLIALIIIILAGTMLKFSNQAFLDDMRVKASEQIDKQVQSGRISQQDADQAKANMEQMGGGMQKIFSIIGIVIFTPIMILVLALIYWLIVRFIAKGKATYSLILSTLGLLLYFGVIDQILTIILMMVTGNYFANLSPAIFMKPDIASPVFKLMLNINPISIWSYYVMGIALHKVASISRTKGMLIAFVPWILYIIVGAFLNLGF
jgi:hypothetical protein